MPFKTAAEMFGDGAGFGAVVPYATTNPPGTGAGNRGIQFGEQLTASIANRPHYALALNDENLNTRIASFESGGLDAAYDLGAVASPGGGRDITKDGGAVETISATASQRADDIANAHFRANQLGDTIRGGGGFESVSYGRSGVSALHGFLDRRAVAFSGTSVLADTIAATLVAPRFITIGAGQWYDGSNNRDIVQGFDMVEILSGVDRGLYVIEDATTSTTVGVYNLDGTAPSFTAAAVTIRVFRPIFGTFSPHGHSGLLYSGITVMGSPGSEAALELVPGGKDGALVSGTTTDGSKYALRVRKRRATGGNDVVFTVDGTGQVRSTVSSANLTSTQREQAVRFSAAFIAEQDSTYYDAGFVAKHMGSLDRWFGLTAVGIAKPPSTAGGVFAFDFISVPPYNIQLTDTVAADYAINPGVTTLEIVTPSGNVGVYAVESREAATGRVQLVSLAGGAPTLPTVGAGTLQIFFGTMLGERTLSVVTSLLSGHVTSTRAAAVISAPKQSGGTAVVFEAGNHSGGTTDRFFFRGVVASAGVSGETASLSSRGEFAVAGGVQVGGAFTYSPAPVHHKSIFPSMMSMVDQAGVSDWNLNIAGNADVAQPRTADVLLAVSLPVPMGATIQKVVALVRSNSARATITDRFRMQVFKRSIDWVTAGAPTMTQQGSDRYNGAGAGYDFIEESTTFVLNNNEDVMVLLRAPSTVIGANDYLIAIDVVFADPGPRNY